MPDDGRAPTVVRAVRARDELLVRALEGEPRLEVVLLRRREVERAGDDSDDAVGDAEALVERLRGADHLVEHLPALLWGRHAELLDLLELVHPEDAPHVAPGRAGLLAEAGRVAGVLERELRLWRLEPLARVKGRNGLL